MTETWNPQNGQPQGRFAIGVSGGIAIYSVFDARNLVLFWGGAPF
jgi:hypothetical protein